MKPTRWLLLALFVTVHGSPFTVPDVSAQNASPTLIPFQGRLTDQAGVAYTNGQYTLTFNLYDQAVGGSTVWTERHEKIGVINGTVNVFLGSIQSIGNVAFDTTKYLGITVDADDNPATADPEMVPRTMIIPAFYAKNAESLAGHNWTHILTGGSNNPQTGFINGGKIGGGTVTNVQIQDGGVTTDDIGNGQVTGAKLAAGVVDAGISDESITSQKIKNGEVGTIDLANGSVTVGKLAADVETRLTGIETKIADLEFGKWTELIENLGVLPVNTTAEVNYSFPPTVPLNARQVLIFCWSSVGNSASNDNGHIDVYTKEGLAKYTHRFRHVSYPNDDVSYNSSTFWIPLTSDRKIYFKGSTAHSTQNTSGTVQVLGWR